MKFSETSQIFSNKGRHFLIFPDLKSFCFNFLIFPEACNSVRLSKEESPLLKHFRRHYRCGFHAEIPEQRCSKIGGPPARVGRQFSLGPVEFQFWFLVICTFDHYTRAGEFTFGPVDC